jgi:hypothetical protein
MIVEPINTKKALAAEVVWRYVESSNNPKFDFLLTIGVNREDEHLFGWANELERTGVVDYTMTVTIGSHSAEAKTTLTQGVTGRSRHSMKGHLAANVNQVFWIACSSWPPARATARYCCRKGNRNSFDEMRAANAFYYGEG